MNENLDWDLLAKYLFDECSDEEAACIESDPELQSIVEDLRRVWVVTGRPPTRRDVDANWSRIQAHIRQSKPPERRPRGPERPSAPGTPRRSRAWLPSAVGIAATIIIVALASVVAVQLQSGGRLDAPAFGAKTYATRKGEQATVHLTDGTLTQMNADSKLTISTEFGEHTREVWLEGEAFFDVADDTSRPFIVHAGEAVARVLGTRFSVHAYPEDGIEIVVAEGKVGFHRRQSSVPAEAVLTAGQIAQIDLNGNHILTRNADVSIRLAWLSGDLVFQDAPFEYVVRTLERRLDLTVQLDGFSTVPGHLNARFVERQPVEEIISIIAITFGLTYEFANGTVTFRYVRSSSSRSVGSPALAI